MSFKLLDLLLMLGLPLSIRSDMGSENIARAMQHLCTWLKVSLDCGPMNHPRAQGAVERMGEWLQEALFLLCSLLAQEVGRLRPRGDLDPPSLY